MANQFEVFISHSTNEKQLAFDICDFLESKNIPCWIAPRNIEIGKDYAESITLGLRACSILLLIFSEHSNNSRYVQREVERAVSYNATIIPFKIENVEPSPSLEFFTSTVQWLDATNGSPYNYLEELHKHCLFYLKKSDSKKPHLNTLTSHLVKEPIKSKSHVRSHKFGVFLEGSLVAKMAFLRNTESSLIIGRKSPSNIIVNQDHISAQHAQIIQNDKNEVYIIDLNSSNGIYINGEKINASQPFKLEINDITKLGHSSNVQIRYLSE